MLFDNDILNKKAKKTVEFLIFSIKEIKIIEDVCSDYESYCTKELEKFDIEPRQFEEEDVKRFIFEILCFATFLIVGRKIHKLIVKKSPLLVRKPDINRIRYFNEKLLDYLEKYFKNIKITLVREFLVTEISPDIQYGYGEQLNAAKRIARYLKAGSVEEELRSFSHFFGYAINPKHFAITQLIAMRYAKKVIGLVDTALKFVFKK